MKLRKAFLLMIFMSLPAAAFSQFYNGNTQHRPGGLNWQQIKTEHFRIIFPEGEDSLAYRSAAILESQYAQASQLTGGTLKNFPIILNNYNDLSNGFVTPFNFRSEIDLSAQKGKGMNPQTGGWLETVLPHELVHATHFNVQQPLNEKKVSIPNLISLLSPDVARAFHVLPPVGLHEGLAVYHETESVAPMGGRGNYTFFSNQFNSNFGSSNRWNMGQTFIPSDYTRPYNRHYISGYSFIDWLHDEYGDEISREAIRFHYHNFFLGYGLALRKKTGKWPGQLYALYEEDLEEDEQQRLAQIPVNTTEKSRIIETPYKGEETHGPKWVTGNSLIFYGSYYNGRTGFYHYDLVEEDFNLVTETFTVGDYNFEVKNGSELYFSNYTRDPLFSSSFTADIRKLDLGSGKSQKLTNNARVYSPTFNGERLLGIQSHGSGGRIIEVLEGGDIKVVKEFDDATPISLKFNPENPQQLAVIVNKRGVQALWVVSVHSLSGDLDEAPNLVFEDASIHDPEWHPGGNKILFTMDAPPAMNVYEYDVETREVLQITSSLYNAFEASYAPDGEKIAYVLQVEDERKIAILEQGNFLNEKVEAGLLLNEQALEQELNHPLLGSEVSDSIQAIKKTDYRSDISWLRPRMLYPVYQEKINTPQYGVGFASIDVLSRQAYSAEITGIQNRIWYDFTYTNKMFYPGFEFSVYSDPEFFVAENPATLDTLSLMRQDRGFSLSLPFNYTFRGDTRLSSIYFSPEVSAEQFKHFNLQSEEVSDFSTRYKAGFFSQLNLGVLRLSRDIQPSSGISFFGLYEQTLNEPTYNIEFPGGTSRNVRDNQWAAYYGVIGFVSPLRKWNQSLRLDLQFLQQSERPIYSNSTIIPMGFSDNAFPNYGLTSDTGFQNVARFSTRYTIPLFYPDNGGLTVPLYLSSVYLTTFTHTLTNMDANDLAEASRSIFGAGFHIQFKVSNLMMDLGVGVAYEPSRNNTQFIFGQF